MRVKFILSLCLIVFMLGVVNAVPVQDQFIIGDNNYDGLYGDIYNAEIFNAGQEIGKSYNIERIALKIFRVGTAGTLRVNITSIGLDGNPDLSNVIAYGTFDATGITEGDTGQWVNVTMTEVGLLDYGTNYSFVAYKIGGDISNHINIRKNTTSNYPGDSRQTTDAGSSWTTAGGTKRDFVFQTFGNSTITINLNSPTNNSFVSSALFNGTFVGTQIKNATLVFWDSTLAENRTFFNFGGSNNEESLQVTINPLNVGRYTWNIYVCDSVECSYAQSNSTFNYGYAINSESYNTTIYETQTGTFRINLNISNNNDISLSSANLIYNGTSYLGTLSGSTSNRILTRSINIPASGTSTKTFYWELLYADGTRLNTTTQSQNITEISLDLCNTTGPLVTPYINFTFIDETSLVSINATIDSSTWTYYLGDGSVTKSFTYSNLTANPSYAFCFSPSDLGIIASASVQYSSSGYPQRRYTLSSTALTNSTTNQALYLLASADGIYSTIQVLDIIGSPIAGVTLTMERQFSNVWTIIGQGTTDSAGTVTFWVNPDYDHRLTATKTGYVPAQVTIQPSQSLYTLTLSGVSSNASYSSLIPGVIWSFLPSSGELAPGTRNFNATVTSSTGNLENCKIELIQSGNLSNILTSLTSITNSSYCFVSVDYNLTDDDRIFGRLSIDTTESDGWIILDADWKWVIIDSDKKPWNSITSFFSELKNLNEFGGTDNRGEFSRIILFFFVSTLLIGLLSYFTGFEQLNPGASILIIFAIVVFASAGGFLTFNSGSDVMPGWLEQYGLAFIYGFITTSYFLSEIRRRE